MSGHRDFELVRLEALATYVCERRPFTTADELAFLLMGIDFKAYRDLGASISGATYLRGERVPIIAEVGPDWPRAFIRARLPRWARLAGGLVAAGVVLAAVRAR